MRTIYFLLVSVVVITAHANDRIAVRVGSGTVLIAKDHAEFENFCDEGTRPGGTLFICKQLQVQRDAASYVITCTDVIFINAAGVEGTAPQVRCDLLTNRALFSGSKDKSVQIIRDTAADADVTRMTADRVEMNLTPLSDGLSRLIHTAPTPVSTAPAKP